MKAILIDEYGGKEKLKETNIPIPLPKATEVLIEIKASSVNPVDIAIREGYLKKRVSKQFPFILGYDVAGVVREIGEEVSELRIGDFVFGYLPLENQGTYAEYVTCSEKFVIKMPSNLSFEEAASIPLVGIASWRSLVDLANIGENKKTLILGGSGGVGSFAVQLAKSFEAYVISTTSSANVPFLEQLGADQVVDYTKQNFNDIVNDFDIIFDTVGKDNFEDMLRSTKVGGTIVSIAKYPSKEIQELAKEKNINLQFLISNPCNERLGQISILIKNKKIKPIISEVLPLSEVQKAHTLSEAGHTRGKIVISMIAETDLH